jgi:hypothetical protein
VLDEVLITQDRLSIRGESGDRDKVILDGDGKFTKIIRIRGASDLLIADLTVANSGEYGIFFFGDSDVQRLNVYNVRFHNCYVRGLKGTDPVKVLDSWTEKHPPERVRRLRPSGGRVRYCLFVNDRVNPHTEPYGGDYIGGIDIVGAGDWTVARNAFVNIRGRHGVGRGAIFFWVNCERIVAERNLIVNCDRGVCFGNPSGGPIHMARGTIRNNFIVAGASQAIEVCQTRDVGVYHNTVWCARANQRAIQFHTDNPGGRCINNLARGVLALSADVTESSNIFGQLNGWFVDPGTGDLHLTDKAEPARGNASAIEDVPEDFDGRKRKAAADVGADEVLSPTSSHE